MENIAKPKTNNAPAAFIKPVEKQSTADYGEMKKKDPNTLVKELGKDRVTKEFNEFSFDSPVARETPEWQVGKDALMMSPTEAQQYEEEISAMVKLAMEMIYKQFGEADTDMLYKYLREFAKDKLPARGNQNYARFLLRELQISHKGFFGFKGGEFNG